MNLFFIELSVSFVRGRSYRAQKRSQNRSAERIFPVLHAFGVPLDEQKETLSRADRPARHEDWRILRNEDWRIQCRSHAFERFHDPVIGPRRNTKSLPWRQHRLMMARVDRARCVSGDRE